MNKKHHENMEKTPHESVKKDTTDNKMPGKGECCDCGASSKDEERHTKK